MLRRLIAAWGDELRALLPSRSVMRIDNHNVLRRTLVLPLAAERNLREVLAFEMDRYTPFKADAVYFHCAVRRRDRTRRQLHIDLAVASRAEADALIEAARREGSDPAALDLGGAVLELRRPRRWLGRALAAACATLLMVAAAVPLWRKYEAAGELEAKADALRGELTRAAQARRELAQLAAEERSLLERRALRPSAIELLAELTRVVPDSAWLSHVELAGAQLRIRGESPDAAELVKAIEASKLFKGAGFDGSVTREPGAARERFSISANAEARP